MHNDWRTERAKDWRSKLNMHYHHNREIHVTLRALPESPMCGYLRCDIPEDSYLVTFGVPASDTTTVSVTFSLDDILTVSREVNEPTPVT